MKRTGKVWTRIFPNIPVSKKPTEVRMGKGKGSPEFWACRVKPGRIIFEVDGIDEATARIALYKASTKLPIKTKFIKYFAVNRNNHPPNKMVAITAPPEVRGFSTANDLR